MSDKTPPVKKEVFLKLRRKSPTEPILSSLVRCRFCGKVCAQEYCDTNCERKSAIAKLDKTSSEPKK